MGELLRETPISEVTATLEVLDRLGIRRGDLTRMRRSTRVAESIAGLLRGEGRGDFFSVTAPGQSIIEMRQSHPDLFWDQDWYLQGEKFAEEKGSGVILLCKTLVPGSLRQIYWEKHKLLGQNEFVPTAEQVVSGILAYHQQHGQWLFEGVWVRTSSVASDGGRVLVGVAVGVVVLSKVWDGSRRDVIGLAVARNS